MKRPFRRLRIDELERLVAATPSDEKQKREILQELVHRTTWRALTLKRRLEGSIKPAQTLTAAATPAPQRPQPIATGNSNGNHGAQDGHDREQEPLSMVRKVLDRGPNEEGSMTASEGTKPVAPAGQAKAEATPKRPADVPAGVIDERNPETIAKSPKTRSHDAAGTSSPKDRVIQLIEYVRKVAELQDKPVWSLSSYRNLVLHEQDLRGRVGIKHDLSDEDGPIYLRVERLERIDPPAPPELAKEWLTISRDPFNEPVTQAARVVVVSAGEADQLVEKGTVDKEDIMACTRFG